MMEMLTYFQYVTQDKLMYLHDFSVAYRYRKSISIIENVVYIYKERETYMFLAWYFSDISHCLSKWFTDGHRNLPGGR